MPLIPTGRALIRVPYHGTTGTYPALLLVKEKSGQYALPGGQQESWETSTREAMIREIAEELRLKVKTSLFSRPPLALSWAGSKFHHDIYKVLVTGTLAIDPSELTGIGFLNTGSQNRIPDHLLAGHVKALIRQGIARNIAQLPESPIHIPRAYFRQDPRSLIRSWEEEKKHFPSR